MDRTAARASTTAIRSTPIQRMGIPVMPMARASSANGSPLPPTWRRRRRRRRNPGTEPDPAALVRDPRDRRRCLRRERREHLQRVNRPVLDPDLEMRVRPGGVSGRSYQPDQLAALAQVALLDPDHQQVAAERPQPGALL